MNQRMFTVYDHKASAYLLPFFSQTKGTAIRSFTESCNDPQSTFFKYPEDFTLFELGEYDDSTAELFIHPSPEPIGKAIEFKNEVL